MSTQNKKTATKPKILTILGPNASGKSELGVQLATIYRGEIISADSRQVYRELNLTAGKVPGKWERRGRRRYFVYNGVSHHLVDLVSPKKQFNVQSRGMFFPFGDTRLRSAVRGGRDREMQKRRMIREKKPKRF